MNRATELLKQNIEIHGSLGAVSRVTGLRKSTLKRIKNGTTAKSHPKTLGKLLSALDSLTAKDGGKDRETEE